jgi:hypothetical protein
MHDPDHHQHQHQHPPETDCPRTRLARGTLAAVDACQCGMLQVHIGALTLRMAPCALTELANTLHQAVAAHARRFCEPQADQPALGLGGRNRGEA